MKMCLASTNKSNKNKKGYYGGMQFLDSQKNITLTFGKSPILMPTKPTDRNDWEPVLML